VLPIVNENDSVAIEEMRFNFGDNDNLSSLVAMMPKDVVPVSESGLKSADDLSRLSKLGYSAFLMGERFMTDPDPGGALARLLDVS